MKAEFGGKIHHYVDGSGYENWRETNDHNQTVHSKDTDGEETWTEYNDQGSITHERRELNGMVTLELWKEYDKNNNIVYSRRPNGQEYFYEYDEKSKLIYMARTNKTDFTELMRLEGMEPTLIVDRDDR